MPANLPPQFYELEKEYREKKDIEEKIEILKKMYAVMPKHKGTDKLQADIKAKISKLKEELDYQKKNRGKRSSFYIEKEGAGQITIVGPTNTGKSTLFVSLSNAFSDVAPYPYTTKTPIVGMANYEDIKFQLIDLPPLTKEVDFIIIDIIRNCDLILIVLSFDIDYISEFNNIISTLNEKGINILEEGLIDESIFEPLNKRGVIFINKSDLVDEKDIQNYIKNLKTNIPIVYGSSLLNYNMDKLLNKIFEGLNIIRVYTKEPGKPPDMKDPLILKKGSNVIDAATKLHKEIGKNLKYARLWGSSKFDGQRVMKDYILKDKDILEFHTKWRKQNLLSFLLYYF